MKVKKAKKASNGVVKKAQNSLPKDSLRARIMTEMGPRRVAVDTAGYSAGKGRFPGTVLSSSGKRPPVPKIIGRGTVDRILGVKTKKGFLGAPKNDPRRRRSEIKKGK